MDDDTPTLNVCRYRTRDFIIMICILCMIMAFALSAAGLASVVSDTQIPSSYGYKAIALGIVLMIVSIFGMYGSKRKNHYALFAFWLIFLLCFIMLFFVAIILMKPDPKDKEHIKRYLAVIYKINKTQKDKIHSIQSRFQCCGIDDKGSGAFLRKHQVGRYHKYNQFFRTCCFEIKDICKDTDDDFIQRGCWQAMTVAITRLLGLSGLYIAACSVFFIRIAILSYNYHGR